MILNENLETLLIHGCLVEGEPLCAGDLPDLLHRGLHPDSRSEESSEEAAPASPRKATTDHERIENIQDVSDQLGLRARRQTSLDRPVLRETPPDTFQVLSLDSLPALLRQPVVRLEALDDVGVLAVPVPENYNSHNDQGGKYLLPDDVLKQIFSKSWLASVEQEQPGVEAVTKLLTDPGWDGGDGHLV